MLCSDTCCTAPRRLVVLSYESTARHVNLFVPLFVLCSASRSLVRANSGQMFVSELLLAPTLCMHIGHECLSHMGTR